jgi:ABC-type amino acid transport substrate-binding protein
MEYRPARLPGIALLLAFLARPAAGLALDLPEIKKRGSLRVLVAEGAPEFFSWKPGTAAGLDREILEGFARLNRLDLAIVPVTSGMALIPALLKDQGDVVAGGVAVTEALSRQIEFSSEVFPTRYVVLTRKPHRVVRTMEELREERVGVVRGSGPAEAVAEAGIPSGQVDDTLPPGGVPQALKAKKVTAAILGVEYAIPAQKGDPDLQLGLFVGPRRSLAFGVRKEDVKLRQSLNEYLANLRRTPTWNRLVLTYFGPSAVEILRAAKGE